MNFRRGLNSKHLFIELSGLSFNPHGISFFKLLNIADLFELVNYNHVRYKKMKNVILNNFNEDTAFSWTKSHSVSMYKTK